MQEKREIDGYFLGFQVDFFLF